MCDVTVFDWQTTSLCSKRLKSLEINSCSTFGLLRVSKFITISFHKFYVKNDKRRFSVTDKAIPNFAETCSSLSQWLLLNFDGLMLNAELSIKVDCLSFSRRAVIHSSTMYWGRGSSLFKSLSNSGSRTSSSSTPAPLHAAAPQKNPPLLCPPPTQFPCLVGVNGGILTVQLKCPIYIFIYIF